VALEMEYDVLKPDYLLLPHFDLYNAEGVRLFISVDRDPAWRRRPRPVGRYRSTAWIPGNLLTEGTHFVEVLAVTLEPPMLQYAEREAVAFEVIDSFDGDSARADWTGRMTSVMRPLLEWQTRLIEPSGSPSGPVTSRA